MKKVFRILTFPIRVVGMTILLLGLLMVIVGGFLSELNLGK